MHVTSLYIEITNQCNLNCSTCYNRSGLNRERMELSAEELEQIIKLFLPYGLERILLSGGEPTLHTEFEKILDLIDKYPDLSFGISTNGTIHNVKLIDYLNSRDNFTLQLSLDGSCEEYNAKTRGYGNFEKALLFAKKIRTEKSCFDQTQASDSENKPHKPTLKMVVSQHNLADVEAFCQLASSIGFISELAFLSKAGNGIDAWSSRQLTPQQKLQVRKLADRINQGKNAHVFLPLCTGTCPYAEGLQNLSLCIRTDGSIHPCQMLCDSHYTVGNALCFHKESFEQQLNHITKLARQRSRQDYGCKKCLLNSHCGKGCMAEAWNQHQNPLANDENCAYRKLQFLYHELPQLAHVDVQ